MARRRKEDQPIGVGMTAKQMKRKKPISLDLMRDIEPLTDNQKLLFGAYEKGQHIVAYGCAGTGKTFITLYNALQDVLEHIDNPVHFLQKIKENYGDHIDKFIITVPN